MELAAQEQGVGVDCAVQSMGSVGAMRHGVAADVSRPMAYAPEHRYRFVLLRICVLGYFWRWLHGSMVLGSP